MAPVRAAPEHRVAVAPVVQEVVLMLQVVPEHGLPVVLAQQVLHPVFLIRPAAVAVAVITAAAVAAGAAAAADHLMLIRQLDLQLHTRGDIMPEDAVG